MRRWRHERIGASAHTVGGQGVREGGGFVGVAHDRHVPSALTQGKLAADGAIVAGRVGPVIGPVVVANIMVAALGLSAGVGEHPAARGEDFEAL